MAAEPLTPRRRRNPALLLEPREEQWGYAVAGTCALALALISQPWRGGGHALWFGLGALFPAALAVAVWTKHRLWAAIAAFLVVFDPAWSVYFVVGALPLAYAFLLARRGRQLLLLAPPAPRTDEL